jgi:hypothetical protein
VICNCRIGAKYCNCGASADIAQMAVDELDDLDD